MDSFSAENFFGKVLDHLGLVAAKIHDLKLVQRIDNMLPLHGTTKVTMGERVAAIVLNGLVRLIMQLAAIVDSNACALPIWLSQKMIFIMSNNAIYMLTMSEPQYVS